VQTVTCNLKKDQKFQPTRGLPFKRINDRSLS
jgi:hypothetical protein